MLLYITLKPDFILDGFHGHSKESACLVVLGQRVVHQFISSRDAAF